MLPWIFWVCFLDEFWTCLGRVFVNLLLLSKCQTALVSCDFRCKKNGAKKNKKTRFYSVFVFFGLEPAKTHLLYAKAPQKSSKINEKTNRKLKKLLQKVSPENSRQPAGELKLHCYFSQKWEWVL